MIIPAFEQYLAPALSGAKLCLCLFMIEFARIAAHLQVIHRHQ